VTLSGNQVGVLLLDYIINARRLKGSMPEHPAAIKTIVTTEMVSEVGRRSGVRVLDTFTGLNSSPR
jgi:phosphoglucomutase